MGDIEQEAPQTVRVRMATADDAEAVARIYGYYVLPFLLGDRFAARVDLKADRKTSTLIVHASYVEAGMEPKRVAAALAAELRSMADWLALESFVVHPKGNLAPALKRALRS